MKRRKLIKRKRAPVRKPSRPVAARPRVRNTCINYLLEPHPELM